MGNPYITIYLIRHGRQSSRLCNVDVDLSLQGLRQAALVGERLAGNGIQTVYSSALIRAEQTARTANQYWNAEYVTEPELREIDFGQMEGLSDQEISLRFGAWRQAAALRITPPWVMTATVPFAWFPILSRTGITRLITSPAHSPPG